MMPSDTSAILILMYAELKDLAQESLSLLEAVFLYK